MADKVIKVSRSPTQSYSESETEIINERYITPEERQQIID